MEGKHCMKVVLTGKPGTGKTTVIKKVVLQLKEKAEGFYTEEFRDKTGKREGFNVITLDGKKILLASKKIKTPFKVGSYSVNLEEFEETVLPALKRALNSRSIIIIDEIGKMELFSDRFAQIVKDIFSDENTTVIATVPVKNIHPIVSWIKKRPDVLLLEVDYKNRDTLPQKILNILEKH